MLRAAAILIASAVCACAQHRLDMELMPQFAGRPLAFDALAHETGGGQLVSFTRCDLLLSSAALQRDNGEWIGAEDWVAFVCAREGRTRFVLTDVPAGKFTRLRFHVGVPPAANASDPAQYAAGHPLNPNVNGMHWGWAGGYVFAALEGRWRTADGALGGWSYHVATNANLATVELAIDLDLAGDHALKLMFDVARVFDGIKIAHDTTTTHSRKDDPLAAQLRDNLARAFSVASLARTPTRAQAAAKGNALIAPGATPYQFTFPATFPHPALPLDNPLTDEGVALGKKLFHSTLLSGNRTQSCASCHDVSKAFTDTRKVSVGASGESGTRNAMPLFNLAWKSAFFWDGRAASLRAQVLQPIQSATEMHASLADVVAGLTETAEFPPMFTAAFGNAEINADRIARALEQFLLTLVTRESKFDRALRNQADLSPEEKRGFELFHTEFDPARGMRGADCFHCHGGPLFASTSFANNGIDWVPTDIGLAAVTHLDGDRGRFSTPSLRNVARTAPYMHDGRFATLEDVIEHYDHGVRRSPTLDPNLAKHPIEGLGLSAADKRALVAFLKTLGD